MTDPHREAPTTWVLTSQSLDGDYVSPPRVLGTMVSDRAAAFAALYERACAKGESATKGTRAWSLLREGDVLYLYYRGALGSAITDRYALMEVVAQVRTQDITPGRTAQNN